MVLLLQFDFIYMLLFPLKFLLHFLNFPTFIAILKTFVVEILFELQIIPVGKAVVVKFDLFVLVVIVDGLPIVQQFLESCLQILLNVQKIQILASFPLHIFDRSFQCLLPHDTVIFSRGVLLETFDGFVVALQEGVEERGGRGELAVHVYKIYSDVYTQLAEIIFMSEQERRQKLFYNRAHHQIREIEHNCREVIAFSKQLGQTAADVADSEVNSRKMEFLKSEITQKLKEFANIIDEVYKVIDRKIVILMNQIMKEQANSTSKTAVKTDATASPGRNTKETEQTTTERLFSDTLNPRITHLEAKIAEYQSNEEVLNKKVNQLRSKNEKLLEEFNRLSTASNQKINELSIELSHLHSKDSFSSENDYYSPVPLTKNASTPQKPKKTTTLFFESDQQSYHQSYEPSFSSQLRLKEQKNRVLTFGCMPSKTITKQKNPLSISNLTEDCEKLDRNDRNRRFDLLLNKLRDSQQDSTEISSAEELNKPGGEELSVFSQNVVRRYQI